MEDDLSLIPLSKVGGYKGTGAAMEAVGGGPMGGYRGC